MIKILALSLLLPFAATAAGTDPQFLKMVETGVALISNPPGKMWKEGEFLCVYKTEKASACGVVNKVEPEGAYLKLDFSDDGQLGVGDRVAKPRPQKEPGPAVVVESDNVWLRAYTKPRNWFRTALLWDVDQVFWTLGYNRAISSHVALGFKFDVFDVFNVNRDIDGYGVLLTRTFFTLPYYGGIAALVGVGPFFFRMPNASGLKDATTLIVEVNMSWRFQLKSWLGVGFQFGMRWIPRPAVAGFNLGTLYHPIRGAVGIDLSIRL